MKRPSMQIGLGIALGAGIGIAVDVLLGTGGAWLAIGIAIGVAIGAGMARRKAVNDTPTSPETAEKWGTHSFTQG